LIIARLNAGMSSGLRLDTKLPSTTTSWSTHSAGVSEIGLERRPRGDLAPARRASLDDGPRAVADRRDRLAGVKEGICEFRLHPKRVGVRTRIHHHGEQQTIAHVLSGACEVRWGERGEFTMTAKVGDFLHVPAFLPHMEINPSDSQPFRWVVVRSTSTPIVVNLPDDTWP
jgi:mannose-6-phosphate isomerase-like protein (cupin superfamily)